MNVAFTGNRDYTDRAALYKGIDQVKAERWYFGGARGADNDALEYLSRTQPGTERVVVTPNRLIDQPFSVQETIRTRSTQIVELKNTGPDRFQVRNKYMVDQADKVVAFNDGRTTGGTANTIRYAESVGKPVEMIRWQDVDMNDIMAKNEDDLLDWIELCREQNVQKLAIKRTVIQAMKQFAKETWPKILDALHQLR
jgi:hypothetical protein